MRAGEFLEAVPRLLTPNAYEEKRLQVNVVFFAGRTVLNGGGVWVAGLLARTRGRERCHYLKLASLPEQPEHRGGYEPYITSRSATLSSADYPVYVSRLLGRQPPDGERELWRVSVPLYPQATPNIEGWPVDLFAPMTVWEENIVGARPPLPAVDSVHPS
jgi:hypothetical protein